MNYLLILRLTRPLIHFTTILVVFLLAYNLRTITDGIPFVHLQIPNINFQETLLFSIISALLFPLI